MMKLADKINAIFNVDPEAPAVEFNGQWHSWRDIASRATRLSALLDHLDLGVDTRVGVLLRNHVDMVSVLVSLFSSHRCLASLNALSPDSKLADDIVDANTPVLVALASDWGRPEIREAAQKSGAAVIALNGDDINLLEEGVSGSSKKPVAEGIVIEMLSSGTTGKPKRIPLKRTSFESALAGAASYEKGRDDSKPRLRSGVQIVTAPLAHIAGITGLSNNLFGGRKVCLIERFTVDGFRDAVVRHRPKVAGAPPSALRMLMDANIPPEDFSSLVAFRTGTAPLDPELADAFYERYQIPVLQNYGATEFSGGVAGWTLDDFKNHWRDKWGAVGRLNAGVEARIVDPESQQPVADGAEGLLELRAPNVGDGATWVRTTDLAVLDSDRFLWIKGRFDGAIIRGGFKILPDDVVKAMQEHPSVLEAAVVGIPDPRLGQVPVAAYIVRASAPPITPDQLKAWLKQMLLPYQVPVVLKQVDELPRTPSLKVSQPQLKEMFL